MQIFRYKANSPTGFEIVNVVDDYELKKGELAELPTPCYTPMKLDSAGNLVSATVEESNQAAKNYLEKNGLNSDSVSTQQQIAMLSTQIATQQQNQIKANAVILSEIAELKTQIQKQNANDSSTATADTSKEAN